MGKSKEMLHNIQELLLFLNRLDSADTVTLKLQKSKKFKAATIFFTVLRNV